ncbi:MAG: hypothetical protein J6D14_01975 [Lachnospiraceae bacterium]|nr:hypothetical protein [Lachnospiraceae bacterium]
MTIRDLIEKGIFETVNAGDEPEKEITSVFCCDLLSIAMSRGVEGAAWVTVMGNINTLAVMTLTDMSCIVLAEGTRMDETGLQKAQSEGFTVLRTEKSIFDASLEIYRLIHGE